MVWAQDSQQKFWRRKVGDEAHGNIFATVEKLEQRQQQRATDISDQLSAYLDRQVISLSAAMKDRTQALWGSPEQIHLNVSKSCVDTVASKLVAQRPRPMAVTINGKFADRQRAKKLDRWLEGWFYQQDLYDKLAPRVFMDAAIHGTGALEIGIDEDNEVFLDWAWIGEFIIDELASAYAPPRVLYRRRYISRDVLVALYPDKEHDLLAAEGGLGELAHEEPEDEVIEVIESWHLRSGRKAKDGRYVLCAQNVTLVHEAFNEDEFPFIFFRWGRTPIGFWGIGLVSELQGIQDEINELIGRIQENMNLTATSYVFVQAGTVQKEHLQNVPSIVEYTGSVPPSFATPPSMASDVFNHLWQLYARAYEISGVSQLSATSTKPTGIESGTALQTLMDVETQRFALLARDWEAFFLDVAKQAIKYARKAYGNSAERGKMAWASKNAAKQVSWKDASLTDDAMVLRLYPVNLLPNTPSGKIDRIERLLRMGLMDPAQAKSLLDYPDIEKVQDLTSASYEDFIRIFDDMLYEGEYTPPQVEMFFDQGIPLAQHYWCLGHKEGAPEKHLDLFVTWMQRAREVQAEARAQQKAQEEAMMMMSGAMAGGAPGDMAMMGGPGGMPGAAGPQFVPDVGAPTMPVAGMSDLVATAQIPQ